MSAYWLNLAGVRHGSHVNGPGMRSVVWVQGCTLACPGCFNPATHPHRQRQLLDPVALGRALLAIPDESGVTLSGGEPFQQADACADLAETVRAGGRSVIVFSGYTLDVLERSTNAGVQRLLAAAETVVAGPYRPGPSTTDWRGGPGKRLRGAREPGVEDASVELRLTGEALETSGFPTAEDREWARGIAAWLSGGVGAAGL